MNEFKQEELLESLYEEISKKEKELIARAALLNDKVFKDGNDSWDQDHFTFYQIFIEAEYMDEKFDRVFTDRILIHEGFPEDAKSDETTDHTPIEHQLVHNLTEHFKNNMTQVHRIQYYWFSLKLEENQLIA